MDDTHNAPKAIKTLFNRTYTVDPATLKEDPEWKDYMYQTVKLLFGVNEDGTYKKGTYNSVFRMVRTWPKDKLIERYTLATKHNGDMPSNVYWWWKRKQEKK